MNAPERDLHQAFARLLQQQESESFDAGSLRGRAQTAYRRRRRTQMTGIAFVGASLLVASGFVVTNTRSEQRPPVALTAEEELERYRAAADYELILPELQPGERWVRVSYLSEKGFTSGDLTLSTLAGPVHIWETDLPPASVQPKIIGVGEPVSFGEATWWKVEGVAGDAERVQFAWRSPEGILLTIDGEELAARSVVERITGPFEEEPPAPIVPGAPLATSEPRAADPDGWVRYRSATLGIELSFPRLEGEAREHYKESDWNKHRLFSWAIEDVDSEGAVRSSYTFAGGTFYRASEGRDCTPFDAARWERNGEVVRVIGPNDKCSYTVDEPLAVVEVGGAEAVIFRQREFLDDSPLYCLGADLMAIVRFPADHHSEFESIVLEFDNREEPERCDRPGPPRLAGFTLEDAKAVVESVEFFPPASRSSEFG